MPELMNEKKIPTRRLVPAFYLIDTVAPHEYTATRMKDFVVLYGHHHTDRH